MSEVLCPDCGEIRSLKGLPDRGLLVKRCPRCAHTVLWHWALGTGGRPPHFAPCMIVRCGLCNEPRLVLASSTLRAALAHCRRCSYRCFVRWQNKPTTGDRRRRAEAVSKDSALQG
jgi:hypothetical protein